MNENSSDELDDVDVLDQIVTSQDLILENQESIYSALDRITDDSFRRNSIQALLFPLTIAMSPVEDDEQHANTITSLFQFISLAESESFSELAEYNASDELVDFIKDLTIEYGEELARARYRITQGEEYWSYADSDIILSDDNISLRHTIEVDESETIEFDSAPHSDWPLISHFIQTQIDLYDIMGEEAIRSTDPNQVGDAIAKLQWIKQKLESAGVEVDVPEIGNNGE